MASRVAAPLAPEYSQPYSAIGHMTDTERAELADKWGYNHIGKELPDDVRLSDVIKSMPRSVFEINNFKAWGAVVTSLIAFPASLALIHVCPTWFLPIAWAISGTAFTGWFVIGHDCGHRAFSKNKLLEDIVGTFFFAPLIYPFEPWRIKHNQHHAFTNKLVSDTAWHPVMQNELDDMNSAGTMGAPPPRPGLPPPPAACPRPQSASSVNPRLASRYSGPGASYQRTSQNWTCAHMRSFCIRPRTRTGELACTTHVLTGAPTCAPAADDF